MTAPTTQHQPPTTTETAHDDDDQEYDEPVWDEAALMAIQLIETQHYNTPPHAEKKLQKLKTPPPPASRKQPLRRTPVHLEVQLAPQPAQSLLAQNVLSKLFGRLTPSSTNNGLYQRFRAKKGLLSVSDLVSCLWCEVQVEYGLLGKRHLKPNLRPSSFLSSAGVQINVNPKLVISRQIILDGGTKVHNKLEKEVAPEKVHVQVLSPVDSWGLKVLNTIVSLSLLRSTGMMREIPVWGFVGGFLVQGIVDQIDLVPRARSPSAATREPDDGPGPASGDDGPAAKDYVVRISDSKTTQGESLPAPHYTESARYQLMLYKYLYDQHASGSFDLERFSKHLGLDLDERFSEPFLRDAQPILASLKADCTPTTLREIFGLHADLVSRIGGSHSTLEIVYRRRGTTRSERAVGGNARKKIKAGHNDTSPGEKRSPTPVLASPITASAADDGPVLAADPQQPAAADTAGEDAAIEGPADPALIIPGSPALEATRRSEEDALAGRQDRESSEKSVRASHAGEDAEDLRRLAALAPASSSLASLTPKPTTAGPQIIGAFEFVFHPLELFGFVSHALAFWNGDAPPVGVDIRDHNKCSPCEFKDSCEWRAKLANRIIEALP
ncbi:hypothetical protein PtB15_14B209 [Puccinia triticina]|nr:hypothetical protein PtB15_14B209 [Puccinia triticina]